MSRNDPSGVKSLELLEFVVLRGSNRKQWGNLPVAKENFVEQACKRIIGSALKNFSNRREKLEVCLAFGLSLLGCIHSCQKTLQIDPLEHKTRRERGAAR